MLYTIEKCKREKIAAVQLTAAGSQEDNANQTKENKQFGYHVWPEMGFDAPLTDADHAQLPKEFQSAQRVSDLMLDEEGIDAWKKSGSSRKCQFDLSSGSRSFEVMEYYKERKKISI